MFCKVWWANRDVLNRGCIELRPGQGETGCEPGCEPACCENNSTINNNAAREATKKQLVFCGLLSLSATHFQGSPMAAAGEWRDELCCLKLTFASLDRAIHY